MSNLEVYGLLLHWQNNQVKLNLARQKWLDGAALAKTVMGNFLLKSDRQALGKYLITGELLKGEVGSLVMFSFPRGYLGHLNMNELIFQTIEFESLMESRLKCDNIVDAAVNYLRSSIQKLTENILKKHIIVDINFESVNLSKTNVITKIASLNPSTISWNNVCDYYTAQDFHKMAKLCSGKSTVHFAFSLSWPRIVNGTCVYDYIGDAEAFENLDTLIYDFYENQIPSWYEKMGCQKILRSPFVDNPVNIADYSLHAHFYLKWADYFFSKAISGISNRVTQTKEVKSFHNFFTRVSSTIYFKFSYDPEM